MESELEKNFFEYLRASNFPHSSVVYQPTLQSTKKGISFRPDFALVDPKNNEPLAIIEIKGSSDKASVVRAFEQLQEYLATLKDQAVRGYVVTPSETVGGFNFYTLDNDGSPKRVPSAEWLNFQSLSTAKLAEKKELLAEEKNETTAIFDKSCRVISIAAVLIAIADFFLSLRGVTLLTSERMTLIGAAVALVLIPYVQKFKWLGLEIERNNNQSKG